MIPDVQSDVDRRELAIDRVGIRALRYPLRFADGGETQATVATWSVSVALPHDRKGTHMSRLLALVDEAHGALTVGALPGLLDTLLERLDAPAGTIEFAFPWFVRKRAPVSGVESAIDYDATIIAEAAGSKRTLTVRLIVPVTSLCPSSKAISDYGAHNQRSHVTLTARIGRDAVIPMRELIAYAESEASSELYGVLKRSDEKYVTERAYDNPRFVEDLARGVAARLLADSRVDGFRVEAENFESIHNHSAYARIDHGL